MDKIKLTKEMMESGKNFEELGIKFVERLPYLECEECAVELTRQTVILDESGICYEAYTSTLTQEFLAAKYFTNIDTDDWDTREGRAALYDFFRRAFGTSALSTGCWTAGWCLVSDIHYSLTATLERKHEREHSLSYKIGKMFGSILDGNEDVIQKLAESREVSEKMIDMIKVFEDHKKTEAVPMKMFAKK